MLIYPEHLDSELMANRKLFDADAFWGVAGYAATADDLIAHGSALAEQLIGARVVSLVGPLGAGKTHFVKGLALGLDSNADVSSPTFTLVHEYDDGRIPLVHFDFYRLESANDVAALGWEDYLAENSLVVVEWGNRFPEILPAGSIEVEISIEGNGRRIAIGEIL